MAKIFVHTPLKRAEWRRLSRPPEPPPPAFQPSWARLEPDVDPEKEARLAERAAQRAKQRRVEQLIEAFAENCAPVVIDGPAFLRWLTESLARCSDRGAFIDECNVIMLADNLDGCLICGSTEPLHPEACGFIIFPDIFPDEGLSIGAATCSRCAGMKPRFYAAALVKIAITHAAGLAGRTRRLSLTDHDRDLLAWLDQPRRGADLAMVRHHVRSGVMDEVMQSIEALIYEN